VPRNNAAGKRLAAIDLRMDMLPPWEARKNAPTGDEIF